MSSWFSLSLRQTGDRRLREDSRNQIEENCKCTMRADSNRTVDFEMKSQNNISLQIYGQREVAQITKSFFCCYWL